MTSVNNYTPEKSTGKYGLAEGSAICTLIEPVVSQYGHHTALTGGCLYGSPGRKDIDIIIYRRRDLDISEMCKKVDAMIRHLYQSYRMRLISDHGFVKKFDLDGIPVDCMFPEWVYGDYGLEGITQTEKGPLPDMPF